MPSLPARHDPALAVRVLRSVPLRYAAGADPSLDRPAHVRSASGLAWVDGSLAVLQDDANFVAIADPETGLCAPLTLPAGEGGLRQFDGLRGNKRFKLDMEACTAVPTVDGDVFVAFGSGSTARREGIVIVHGIGNGAPRVERFHAPGFYAALRASAGFAGSEMNLEGAAYHDGRIHLLNRGNGAPSADRHPADGACSVDWAELRAHLEHPADRPSPIPEHVVRYALGTIDETPLTFTDAAWIGDRLVFTATAEDTPNAVDDGPVAGSAVGWIDLDGTAALGLLVDDDGSPLAEKVEGVAAGLRPGTLFLCTDPDDPRAPSSLLEVELTGPWPF